ncbi:ATP-binding cassette domain-containing protein [Anaeromyxobacter oryzae]|uniref:ABC transporter ATP-binding protein n=1 Tax=Anaeromyxobacter oryzae TaxID=2918170 RepID=A0ABM7X085_9BACT|nr:ATP-binding cassette domain-containing protein [Anaeromyxobacter oryzae]BDG05145.1 ABC transporter ATP-binding protein [Anaeromyxobacter oryzae]
MTSDAAARQPESGLAYAIEARGLVKRFGALAAVDGVDLAVRPGELFGLLGPNGAGKTTLVRILTGIVSPTSGDAFVAGIDVRRDPDGARRRLGVVPQALTSDLDLTGYENLDIFARFFEVPRARRQPRIEELLRRVGLWERRKDLVKTYSGGMRRRLEIARGLVHKPRVLFLDEPTIGLDPQSRRVIWDLLGDLRKGDEITISLTTHYLDEAEALCDRVAIVDHGKVVALGTPQELKALIPGSDTLDLGVVGPLPDGVLDALRALPGARSVDVPPQGLRIRADGGAALIPRAIELLREAAVEVTSASLSRITLEDVFIHFTGRSLREEGPGKAGPPRRFT